VWRTCRFIARHPAADLITASLAIAWRFLGWPAPILAAAALVLVSAAWRLARPASFARLVSGPMRARWRRWRYQRDWPAVMTIAGLAVHNRGRLLLPLLGQVTTTGYIDRLQVRLVAGQSPGDFASRADNLAHGFGALSCRIRTADPGSVALELIRRDALADPVPALPIPEHADLRAVPVGHPRLNPAESRRWLAAIGG
jgi:DNA segregation ATPase FtsK/SpoIIIE, S-DNA-T family